MKVLKSQQLRRWLPLFQAFLSIGLLIWVASTVHWAEMLSSFRGVSPAIIGIGCIVYYIGVLLSCLKWQFILNIETITVPFWKLVSWYLIGAFANNFLPTDIGGDIGRGFYAGRYTGRPFAIARSIFLERLTGLGFMLVLAWLGAIRFFPAKEIWLTLPVLALAMGLGIWFLSRSPSARRWFPTDRLPQRLQSLLITSQTIIETYRKKPAQVGGVLLISLLFQLLAGFGLWLNFFALDLLLPIDVVIMAMAMASVASLAPVSLNGWGVREVSLITLLSPLGAESAAIFAGALLARFLVLGLSLVGAIPFILEQNTPSSPREPLP